MAILRRLRRRDDDRAASTCISLDVGTEYRPELFALLADDHRGDVGDTERQALHGVDQGPSVWRGLLGAEMQTRPHSHVRSFKGTHPDVPTTPE